MRVLVVGGWVMIMIMEVEVSRVAEGLVLGIWLQPFTHLLFYPRHPTR